MRYKIITRPDNLPCFTVAEEYGGLGHLREFKAIFNTGRSSYMPTKADLYRRNKLDAELGALEAALLRNEDLPMHQRIDDLYYKDLEQIKNTPLRHFIFAPKDVIINLESLIKQSK